MLLKSHLNVPLRVLLFCPCAVRASSRKWLVSFGSHLSQRGVNERLRTQKDFSCSCPRHCCQVSPQASHLGWTWYRCGAREMSLRLQPSVGTPAPIFTFSLTGQFLIPRTCWQQTQRALWHGWQPSSVARHSFGKRGVEFPRTGDAATTDFHRAALDQQKRVVKGRKVRHPATGSSPGGLPETLVFQMVHPWLGNVSSP